MYRATEVFITAVMIAVISIPLHYIIDLWGTNSLGFYVAVSVFAAVAWMGSVDVMKGWND